MKLSTPVRVTQIGRFLNIFGKDKLFNIEKKRIMLRLKPPGHENAIIDNYVPIFRPGEFKIRRTEDLDLSKIL